MTENPEGLEKRRQELCREMGHIGYFRRGSIAENYRKCGKKNCACAKKGHPGHGPQYLWSTTIKGVSHTKQLPLGPELERYLEENENYREFQHLCSELVRVNETICEMRPTRTIEDPDELEGLKKNLRRYCMKRFKRK